MNKGGALELSIGTIVIIVLAMTMLIFGIIFVKNIMCAGIIITDQVSKGVENQVKNLFGANDYGVRCMGESGQEIRIGGGGRRQIICIINTDVQSKYKFELKSIKSLRGMNSDNVQSWVLGDKVTEVNAAPGQKTVTVATLDIPKRVSDTALQIDLEETNLDTNAKESHKMFIDVSHVGTITSAIC